MPANKSLFLKTATAYSAMGMPAEKVKQALQNGPAVTGNLGSSVLSMESRNVLGQSEIEVGNSLVATFENLFAEIHDEVSPVKRHNRDGAVVVTQESINSRASMALAGVLMASDNGLSNLQGQKLAQPSTAGGAITNNAVGNGFHNSRSIYTAEAFQNYDLQNSRTFSALYNYSITDFDDFTRTFWRPITLSPDSSFVELLINVLTVFNGYDHKENGQAEDWKRKNLVRAIADHTILHTDLTQAIPSKNANNGDFFSTKVAASTIVQAGRDITTAPLVAGKTDIDYIGLCMPDWLIKTGILDQRDGLDPGVKLGKLYLSLAADTIEFDMTSMPLTEFAAAPQGDRQKEVLNFTTGAMPVNKNTLNADGSPLVDLASVVSGELRLKIRIDVQAEINIETGDLVFNTGKPSIRSLQDNTGATIGKADPRYIAIQTALEGVTEVAFTLVAYRSNADRRQIGQRINIRQFAENVVVPWRDPIAAERPAHGSTEQDTADLTALMSATRIRIMNESVTELFKAEAVLAATAVDEFWNAYEAPATLGVGRHYVLPYYIHEELDMLKIVDSLKSSERNADIQAAIVATMRNRLAHAYTESQYKAASDALSGGTAAKPKVAVVTDPVTARYILEPGELRTLVDFELIVVPILDYRMRGKMKMVFISDDGGTDLNFLNFGYLLWSPEHVLVANMTRTGGYNRETQVQPRYRHYVACPIMISIDVKNIEEALKKVTLNVQEQP